MIGRPAIGSSQQQVMEVNTLPAPVDGIDARQAVGDMSPNNCIYTFNLMPAEYGMLLRPGFREWVVGLTGSSGLRTIMAFEGISEIANDDRLFGVTNDGIFDITNFDQPPVLVQAFASTAGDAGHGVYAHYIDQAGEVFLLYADAVNGLFEYQESLDAWQQAQGIIGPVTENISFVVVHKQRLWLIEESSSSAWYLPIASKSGQATEFFFGGKFPHGGELRGLFNWTVATGGGIDDYLVAVSSAGDVIPYQGSDPSDAATWNVAGTYFIGDVPRGRRFAAEYAGNLYFVSVYGIIAMSDLLRGVDTSQVSADSLAFKVARPLRVEVAKTLNEFLWEPKFMPAQGILVVVQPHEEGGQRQIQYTLNLATEGWGIWRDVPMHCLEEWNGKIYFGTHDNQIMVMDVSRDNVLLIPPPDEENGVPITFSLLTSYQDGGTPGLFKQIQMIRPDFLSVKKPSFEVKMLYDYSLSEIIVQTTPLAPVGDLWDIGEWDVAVWEGGNPVGFSELRGVGGVGRRAAIALSGDAEEETRLISFDIMWKDGGPI